MSTTKVTNLNSYRKYKEDKELYRVEKMVFPYHGKSKLKKDQDLTRLIYNKYIEVTGIPIESYDYVINGKPALEWVVDKYAIDAGTRSGIPSDPNDWALEQESDPRWPLLLFLKVITISMRTNEIVKRISSLPI